MRAHILSLATAVPKCAVAQAGLGAWLSSRLKLTPELSAKLCKIFDHAAIDHRHFAISDLDPAPCSSPLYGENLAENSPGTAIRNQIYRKEALPLAARAARGALARWGRPSEAITHIVSVSCTGMMAPGLEFLLIDELGLSRDVERTAVNFMGCFGAMRGLAIAKALALEDPRHRVLMICTELCSLHFQSDHQIDTFVANALFSDGAAALVVGCDATVGEVAHWDLIEKQSLALAESTADMTWDSSDHGYVMRLSARVPGLLQENVKPFVQKLIGDRCSFDDCSWVVHPGGKAVLHKVTQGLGLKPDDMAPSRRILKDFGNMSSPTVLFVLDELDRHPAKPWAVCLAFGPGLSLEGFLLRRHRGSVD